MANCKQRLLCDIYFMRVFQLGWRLTLCVEDVWVSSQAQYRSFVQVLTKMFTSDRDSQEMLKPSQWWKMLCKPVWRRRRFGLRLYLLLTQYFSVKWSDFRENYDQVSVTLLLPTLCYRPSLPAFISNNMWNCFIPHHHHFWRSRTMYSSSVRCDCQLEFIASFVNWADVGGGRVMLIIRWPRIGEAISCVA